MTTFNDFPNEVVVYILARIVVTTSCETKFATLVKYVRSVVRLAATSKRFKALIKDQANDRIWGAFPMSKVDVEYDVLKPAKYDVPPAVIRSLPPYISKACTRIDTCVNMVNAAYILTMMPNLEELVLINKFRGSAATSDHVFKLIAGMHLDHFVIDCLPRLQAYDYSRVRLCSSITKLSLIDAHEFVQEGCATAWSNLERLHIAGTYNFTWPMCKMPKLTHLILEWNTGMHDNRLGQFATMRTIPPVHTLTLSGKVSDFIGKIDKCGCRDSVKRIIIHDSAGTDYANLRSCPKLERVEFPDRWFAAPKFRVLRNTPKLTVASFDLGQTHNGIGFAELDRISALEQVGVRETPMDEFVIDPPLYGWRVFFSSKCCATVKNLTVTLTSKLSRDALKSFGANIGGHLEHLEIAINHDQAAQNQRLARGDTYSTYWDIVVALVTSCRTLKSLTIEVPRVVPPDIMCRISSAMTTVRHLCLKMVDIDALKKEPTPHRPEITSGLWLDTCDMMIERWRSNCAWEGIWTSLRTFELVDFPCIADQVRRDINVHCPNLRRPLLFTHTPPP